MDSSRYIATVLDSQVAVTPARARSIAASVAGRYGFHEKLTADEIAIVSAAGEKLGSIRARPITETMSHVTVSFNNWEAFPDQAFWAAFSGMTFEPNKAVAFGTIANKLIGPRARKPRKADNDYLGRILNALIDMASMERSRRYKEAAAELNHTSLRAIRDHIPQLVQVTQGAERQKVIELILAVGFGRNLADLGVNSKATS